MGLRKILCNSQYYEKIKSYKKQFQCPECLTVWESYVTKNTTEIECPNCDD
jgi:transcription elongation factor Elf1